MLTCPNCNKTFKSKQSFNSHWGLVCKPDAKGMSGINNPNFGKKGKNQYSDVDWDNMSFEELSQAKKRERLFKEAEYKCTQCGYNTKRIDGGLILEIDHIDGNHLNNKKENLRVLCPNCHALTPNFRNWGRPGHKKTSKCLRKGNKDFKTNLPA